MNSLASDLFLLKILGGEPRRPLPPLLGIEGGSPPVRAQFPLVDMVAAVKAGCCVSRGAGVKKDMLSYSYGFKRLDED